MTEGLLFKNYLLFMNYRVRLTVRITSHVSADVAIATGSQKHSAGVRGCH